MPVCSSLSYLMVRTIHSDPWHQNKTEALKSTRSVYKTKNKETKKIQAIVLDMEKKNHKTHKNIRLCIKHEYMNSQLCVTSCKLT